jgi:hypothetical protein
MKGVWKEQVILFGKEAGVFKEPYNEKDFESLLNGKGKVPAVTDAESMDNIEVCCFLSCLWLFMVVSC